MTTEDKLAFLDASQTAESQPEIGTTPAPVPAPDVQQPKTETPLAPESPAPVSAEPPKQDQGHSVPLPKYLDAFNEAREYKKRLAEYETRERERIAQSQSQPPDPAMDPQGYKQYIQRELQQQSFAQLQDQKFSMSELMAKQSLGEAVVKEAFSAFETKAATDPYLTQRILSSQHPYAEIVKWHKQEKLLSDIGDNPEAWAERLIAARVPANQAPAPVAIIPPTLAPVAPPPSLSRAPAAAKPSDVPIGPGQSFSGVFGS